LLIREIKHDRQMNAIGQLRAQTVRSRRLKDGARGEIIDDQLICRTAMPLLTFSGALARNCLLSG